MSISPAMLKKGIEHLKRPLNAKNRFISSFERRIRDRGGVDIEAAFGCLPFQGLYDTAHWQHWIYVMLPKIALRTSW